ncbi:MAG TPA: hypothetical protein PLO23_03680 [Alphaproteobacteria bacterium]|nr:hypothetical protein [Alphaproteobacteria bacterium]
MGKKPGAPRTLRIFTDASFYERGLRGQPHSRSGGGIVLVGPNGKVERAFLINYNNLNLESCSAAEMLTMTIALEHFKGQAVSITGDSTGDVERMQKFVTSKNAFNDASHVMPGFVQDRLRALKGQLGLTQFHHQPRENQYLRIADKLAERADTAAPGYLFEIPVVDGEICKATLNRIAPKPQDPSQTPAGGTPKLDKVA